MDDTHEYFSGEKKLISVTQLLRKHGLSPDYSSVPDAVLAAKSARGTLVHKEIDNYLHHRGIGFTEELKSFCEYEEKHGLVCLASEEVVHNDIVAGTIDYVYCDENGKIVIADHKTTAKLHVETVSWQLSIYAELYRICTGKECDEAKAFHFLPDGSLNVVDIPFRQHEEVLRLLDCERRGEIYCSAPDQLPSKELEELLEVEEIIAAAEREKKEAEARAAKIKNDLAMAMEKNGVKTWTSGKIRVTFVPASTRKIIDTNALKKEYPEIAERFEKSSSISASIRVKLL